MKQKLFMGLCVLGLFIPMIGVGAETIEEDIIKSSDAQVTVGQVDTPVYNVDISWHSLKFDWRYNSETNEYEWMIGTTYDIIPLQSFISNNEFTENEFNDERERICLDQECLTPIAPDVTYEEIMSNIELYYYNTGLQNNCNHIDIGDHSTGGRIVPSVKWTPASGYEYVQGKFKYQQIDNICTVVETEEAFNSYVGLGFTMYQDSNCTTEIQEPTEYKSSIYIQKKVPSMVDLVTEEIPDKGRDFDVIGGSSWYYLFIDLENTEKPTASPKTGDTIGTVTITIKAK